MSDPIGALVAWMSSDPDNQAGDHIYGEELPADVVADMPARVLLIEGSGGVSMTGASKVAADTQRIDLKAYGATKRDANQLLSWAERRIMSIERATLAGTLIHYANRAGGFAAARDRDGQWPMAFQSFQIFYAL